MKKHYFLNMLFLLPALVWGQNSEYNSILFGNSTDQLLRIQTMDSLVERHFFSNPRNIMYSWSVIKKEDFSETAKATMLSYLADRSLSDNFVEGMKNRQRNFMLTDSIQRESLRQSAERRNVDFDVYFELVLEERANRGIKANEEAALRGVPEMLPLLLGWLDYEPAVPVLHSLLSDSLKRTDYAAHNRAAFERSVKLALARMGNREYEQEFIDAFSKANMETDRDWYWNQLKGLYYINSRPAIDMAIESMQRESFYIYTDDQIPGEAVYSSKNLILLTLYYVIQDYPLEFKGLHDKQWIDYQHTWAVFAYSNFYKEQFPFLENWLNEHKNSYVINGDIFIDCVDN